MAEQVSESLPLVSQFDSFEEAWEALTEEEVRLKKSDSPLAFYYRGLFVLEHIWRQGYQNLRQRWKNGKGNERLSWKDGVSINSLLERLSEDAYFQRRTELEYPIFDIWEVADGKLESTGVRGWIGWLSDHLYLISNTEGRRNLYLPQGIFAPIGYEKVYGRDKDPRTNDRIRTIPQIEKENDKARGKTFYKLIR